MYEQTLGLMTMFSYYKSDFYFDSLLYLCVFLISYVLNRLKDKIRIVSTQRIFDAPFRSVRYFN